jgi:peptidoglycan/xylan/chitin deacetylase (PgdA/CDA1 family)
VKKNLLKTIHKIGGFAPFHRVMRGKLLVLMYHRFSREKHPSRISAAEFRAHLEYLRKNCSVLPLSEAVEILKNEKELPPNAAVITIDDGYDDAYEIAFPLLQEFHTPAALYVVTDFLDGKCWIWTDLMRFVMLNTKKNSAEIDFENGDHIKAVLSGETQKMETASRINARLKRLPDEKKDAKIMEIAKVMEVEIPALPTKDFAPITWDEAREMDAGKLAIESHTATHLILTNISAARLEAELQASKNKLENELQRQVDHFCYPNGNYSEEVQKAVENAGYESAVTTVYGFNDRQANQFLLNRIDAPAAIENFAQSASGFEAFRQKIRN